MVLFEQGVRTDLALAILCLSLADTKTRSSPVRRILFGPRSSSLFASRFLKAEDTRCLILSRQ